MIMPTAVEDTLYRLSTVEYAVIAVDRTTGTWFAAVQPWPGMTVNPAACRAAIAAEHGDAAAGPVVIVPVERIPLTEQGNPTAPRSGCSETSSGPRRRTWRDRRTVMVPASGSPASLDAHRTAHRAA